MCIGFCVKCPPFIPILTKLEFSQQIFQKYSNVMKILSVGAELFHTEERTDGETHVQT